MFWQEERRTAMVATSRRERTFLYDSKSFNGSTPSQRLGYASSTDLSEELDEEIDGDLEQRRELFCLLLTDGALPAQDL